MLSPTVWLVLVATAAAGVAGAVGPTVNVEEGAVKGVFLTSASGRRFAAFKGVPYARPPTGKYRFKEPTPVKRWPGVWNASEYGSPCLQYVYPSGPVFGCEDCLFLNVFTPKVPTADAAPLLDVIVYIHGGAFMVGAGSFLEPTFLMDEDVVVVTLNYRLGILGFLSTEDDVVPGNNGLKDQSLALRWVQKNIAKFGGNPAKITISGTSAGGASVHFHYFSPLSQGLFQKGMSFSGTALNAWAFVHGQREKANKVADLLGCSTYTSRDLVDCLRYRPAVKIAEQTKHFLVWHVNPPVPFGPTVEVAGNAPFMNKHPADALLEGAVQDVPWVAGVTSEEGLYPIAYYAQNDQLLEELNAKFHEIAPHLLHYNYTVSRSHRKIVSSRILETYFGGKPISKETTKELIKMEGDRLFYADIDKAVRMMASVNSAPVYFYEFSYRGADSLSNRLSGTTVDMGVSHGDDSAYIFKVDYCNTETTEEDKKMTKLMVSMCVNFARNGDPTPAGAGVRWQAVQPNHRSLQYLSIANSSGLEMRQSADLGNRAFWDSLPINEKQIAAFKIHQQTHNAEL